MSKSSTYTQPGSAWCSSLFRSASSYHRTLVAEQRDPRKKYIVYINHPKLTVRPVLDHWGLSIWPKTHHEFSNLLLASRQGTGRSLWRNEDGRKQLLLPASKATPDVRRNSTRVDAVEGHLLSASEKKRNLCRSGFSVKRQQRNDFCGYLDPKFWPCTKIIGIILCIHTSNSCR